MDHSTGFAPVDVLDWRARVLIGPYPYPVQHRSCALRPGGLRRLIGYGLRVPQRLCTRLHRAGRAWALQDAQDVLRRNGLDSRTGARRFS